jgi:predicted metal-binding transcription factor (methanogenesis marker protein 9)
LIALSAEYNRFRNQILRSAARKSREGTSIILARYVWECRSTRNCPVDDYSLIAAARSGKRAQWRHIDTGPYTHAGNLAIPPSIDVVLS